ncbi:hypothetical protein PAMP_002573 [Pampus punctatissimus]
MSDIKINVCTSRDASSKRTGNQKKKNKRFRQKMQYLERKGFLEEKHKYNRTSCSTHHQAPLHNGEFTKHPSIPTSTQNHCLPHASGAASASLCSSKPSASTHILPSLTVTVMNQGSREKPKGPGNTRSLTSTPSTSVARGHTSTAAPPAGQTSAGFPSKYVALDCEMVGTGPKGRISQLARCSIVSYEGDVVYDKFINPSVPVTDYRTRWSGIRRSDLVKATPYSEARKEILRLLMGKVVIGHAIHNDFKVLGYSHPAALTRDTSRIPLLNRRAGFAETECASLKRLTKAILNRDIQVGDVLQHKCPKALKTFQPFRFLRAHVLSFGVRT